MSEQDELIEVRGPRQQTIGSGNAGDRQSGVESDAEDRIIPRLDAGSAAGAAIAKEAWEVAKAGIAEMMKGDIHYTGPTSEVSVRYNNPKGLIFKHKTKTINIFAYRRENVYGMEIVNVKLDCIVQYDGPQVAATFQIPADGNRSRLANDTYITISPPLTLETLPIPNPDWQRLGVTSYPVIRFPVSIFVDHPWPADNYKLSYTLVLSGWYGYTADGSTLYEDVREVWD